MSEYASGSLQKPSPSIENQSYITSPTMDSLLVLSPVHTLSMLLLLKVVGCQQVLSLPGVAGLHVMAVTDKSRRMAMDLLRSGVLPSNIQSQR